MQFKIRIELYLDKIRLTDLAEKWNVVVSGQTVKKVRLYRSVITRSTTEHTQLKIDYTKTNKETKKQRKKQ